MSITSSSNLADLPVWSEKLKKITISAISFALIPCISDLLLRKNPGTNLNASKRSKKNLPARKNLGQGSNSFLCCCVTHLTKI